MPTFIHFMHFHIPILPLGGFIDPNMCLIQCWKILTACLLPFWTEFLMQDAWTVPSWPSSDSATCQSEYIYAHSFALFMILLWKWGHYGNTNHSPHTWPSRSFTLELTFLWPIKHNYDSSFKNLDFSPAVSQHLLALPSPLLVTLDVNVLFC